MRERANNEAATQIARDLAVIQGALARGEAGPRAAESQAMVDAGVVLVEALRRYLHGEIGRGELDKDANKTWMSAGSRLAESLIATASGPAWAPEDRRSDHLAHSGTRARGVITDVRRDGMGNERVANLHISVSARAADGGAIDLARSVSVPVVSAPRIGDSVEVAYDPASPDHFVYRPLVDALAAPSAPPTAPTSVDRVSRLRELADLLEQGLLTREQFDAEKARVLAE